MVVGSSYLQQLPQYSPDGRKIAFQSDRSGGWGLWTCDADGENCQQLMSFRGFTGGSPRWSADGRWLTFDSRAEGKSQIYVISADGGLQRRITAGNAENIIPSWSHDGRWIYFSSDRSGQWRVWKAPSKGGEAVQVTNTDSQAAFESVDGKYLYFNSELRGNALFRVPADGGEEKQVAAELSWWGNFGVTKNGVYFLSDSRRCSCLRKRRAGFVPWHV